MQRCLQYGLQQAKLNAATAAQRQNFSALPRRQFSEAVVVASASVPRKRLVYKVPGSLKPQSGSALLKNVGLSMPSSVIKSENVSREAAEVPGTSVAAVTAATILAKAIREGQQSAMAIRRRLVRPVFEDRAFKGDMGPAELTEEEAQRLFDEMARTPDSPFAYFFLKEFDAELERRYPDLVSADERYQQFDMEMRARWWYQNTLLTSRFPALTYRRVYVDQPDLSKHTPADATKMFEVPESYSKHYLDLPELPNDGLPGRAMRGFADPLATGEFAYTGTRRVMIREDGLLAAAVLRRFRRTFYPNLAEATEPAGLLPNPNAAATPAAAGSDAAAAPADAGATPADAAAAPADAAADAAAAPAAASSSQPTDSAVAAPAESVDEVAELQKLAGFSLAERGVDADRVAMAQTPGLLKSHWAKKLGPRFAAPSRPVSEALAEAETLDAERLRGHSIVITGYPRGGRSTIVQYAVMQARQDNWLVVHLPNFDQACRGHFMLAPSETFPGEFDQPLLAWRFFVELIEMEADKLKQIKLRGDYFRAETEDPVLDDDRHPNYYPDEETVYPLLSLPRGQGATLYDLCAYGAHHRVQASRIVKAFCDELAQVDEFPVLVVLDGVNAFDDVTGYIEPESRTPITIDKLVFPSAFGRFRLQPPTNGMTLMAYSSTARNDLSDYLRREKNKVTHLKPMPYSTKELQHILMHYASNGALTYPIVDRQLVGEVSAMTNRFPLEVRKYCKIMSIE